MVQRIGNKPHIYGIDQFVAVDNIDTADDFEFAKAVALYLNERADFE